MLNAAEAKMSTNDTINIDNLTREAALTLVKQIEATHGAGFTRGETREIAGNDETGAFYEAWLLEHAKLLDSLPDGTVIAIRFPDGDYVTAPDGLAAKDAFQKQFGTNARGWVHHVGEPVIVGGGYWQISSAV